MDNNKLKAKIKKVESEIAKLLEKEGLEMSIQLDFPRYRQLPDEVLLALKVFQNHSGTVIKQYILKKEVADDKKKE